MTTETQANEIIDRLVNDIEDVVRTDPRVTEEQERQLRTASWALKNIKLETWDEALSRDS